LESNPKLEVKPGFQVAHGPSSEVLILTAETKVYAVDPENWAVAWTQSLTEPIRGPAVIIDNDIFVATLGAKLLKMDMGRKGKVDWDIQLEKPAAGPVTHLPIMGRLALVDTSGALVTVDIKTGKIFWRYGIDAHASLPDVWASRLSAKHIEENKMDWLHKGWTVWSSCGEKRVCFYTPLKGALINRLQLPGTPMTAPLLIEKRLVFFTEAKPGQYVLSHQVEDGETKRIRKERAENSKAESP
jgi:PQQ-like domain